MSPHGAPAIVSRARAAWFIEEAGPLFEILTDQPLAAGGGKRSMFSGPCYDPEFDYGRLRGQIARIRAFLLDGQWRTLAEIADATGDPHASVSAQLRHLRKRRFGSHVIQKRPRGDRKGGLWEYRLLLPEAAMELF